MYIFYFLQYELYQWLLIQLKLYSWWWACVPPETCRVDLQRNKTSLHIVTSVGYSIEFFHSLRFALSLFNKRRFITSGCPKRLSWVYDAGNVHVHLDGVVVVFDGWESFPCLQYNGMCYDLAASHCKRRCRQQLVRRGIVSFFISMGLLSVASVKREDCLHTRQRREKTSVRAGIEGEICSTIISSTPVTSLCGLILGVVKEDAFVTTFFVTFYDVG